MMNHLTKLLVIKFLSIKDSTNLSCSRVLRGIWGNNQAADVFLP